MNEGIISDLVLGCVERGRLKCHDTRPVVQLPLRSKFMRRLGRVDKGVAETKSKREPPDRACLL